MRTHYPEQTLTDAQADWIINHGMSDEARQQLLDSHPGEFGPAASDASSAKPPCPRAVPISRNARRDRYGLQRLTGEQMRRDW